jgi:hypothetical protein
MKEAKLSVIRSIDKALMEQLGAIQDSPGFQKILERYNILEEHQQKIANAVLMALTILLPLILVLIFYIFNSIKKSDLEIREQIISSTSMIIAKRNQMTSYTRKVFGSDLSSNTAFKNKITTLLSTDQIDTSKIQISDFSVTENQGITESSGKLVFKGLSDNNFYDILKKLFVENLFKVKNLNIEKNSSTSLLDGNFDLSFYNKPNGQK